MVASGPASKLAVVELHRLGRRNSDEFRSNVHEGVIDGPHQEKVSLHCLWRLVMACRDREFIVETDTHPTTIHAKTSS